MYQYVRQPIWKQMDIYMFIGKKYISLNIIELQQNRTKVEEIRGGNQDIGIEVDVDIKDNWEFFYT